MGRRENSFPNVSNAQCYFRGSLKCVTSYSSGIRSRIRPLTFLLNYWTYRNEKSNNILNKDNIPPEKLVSFAYLDFVVYISRY